MHTDQFINQYRFSGTTGTIGVEEECFVAKDGIIVPRARNVLQNITLSGNIGPELSACQIEIRTNPRIHVSEIISDIKELRELVRQGCNAVGLHPIRTEVAPPGISLDVSQDETGRYEQIKKSLAPDVLDAACRAAGTHVHIGAANHEEALRMYNQAIQHVERLFCIGDNSSGERIRLYELVAGNSTSPHYTSWSHVHAVAQAKGFESDPSSCWDIIRLSKHGTVEFRSFGIANSEQQLVEWITACQDACL